MACETPLPIINNGEILLCRGLTIRVVCLEWM